MSHKQTLLGAHEQGIILKVRNVRFNARNTRKIRPVSSSYVHLCSLVRSVAASSSAAVANKDTQRCTTVAGGGLPDDNFNLFEDDPIEELDIDLGDMDEFTD
jgi:hypothetical protein